MAGGDRRVPVKCGHSFSGEQLINHNKRYSITSSVLRHQYKAQRVSAGSSVRETAVINPWTLTTFSGLAV